MPDNAIWAVTGPEHDARMARELAWIATGGQTGVVGPWSLEVKAQSTPNNTVRIMPGGFSIAATSQFAAIGYSSAPWQSYMRSIYQPLTVEIDQQGSSPSGGRVDVVGIVIDDPEFEGTSPDVDAHQYWRAHVVKNVGSNATRPEHFASLGRPFLPLAQVHVPANTATITDSMITDIRFAAVNRSYPVGRFAMQQNTVDVEVGDQWVDLITVPNIPVPQWATHAQVSGSASGLQVRGTGRCVGELRGRLNSSSNRGWPVFFRDFASLEGTRLHLPMQGSANVNADERGTTIDFLFQLRRTYGDQTVLRAEQAYARYDVTVIFTQEPVRS